ncbi:NAD-dependent DNA ligase LigA, partial [Klebsiella pneumoniae]|nr:NAD-dependent DNA ligase LigA [Klebsiella pneumoniae]
TVGWGYELSDPLTNQEEHLFEIGKFEDKIKKVSELGLNRDEGVISVKIDGGSILCYYEKGILIKALTRGNGIVGYSVTKKMKKIA